MSPMVLRRCMVRSMDITGVIPEPAVRNSTAAGGGSGMTKLPCGAANRMTVPARTPPTRWLDRNPSGMALTVMVTVRSVRLPRCRGAEVNE